MIDPHQNRPKGGEGRDVPRDDPDRPAAPLEAPGSRLRNTGIGPIGDAPWGTHFCHFYETQADLLDLLVPYFATGLLNNEFCMWVTSEPLGVADAERALRKELPNLDDYVREEQIEILDYSDWYTKGGSFDADRVLDGWVERERSAVAQGFDGLRLTGNTFWLEESDWKSFADYEAKVNSVIGQYRMIAFCSYALDKCGPHEFMDVVHNHQFALVKREGRWEVLASPALQEARRDLLEEIAERKQAEEGPLRAKEAWERTFDAVPDLIAIIDEHYRVVRANRAMAQRLRVTPAECVGKVCFEVVHGLTCAPDFCPHTRTLADGCQHTVEVQEPRLGGEFLVTTTPLVDEQGRRLGSVHVARDITERKRAEEALQNLATLPGENPNPIIRVARDGTVLFANPSSRPLLELWGCEAGASLPPGPYRQVESALAAGELATGETVCGDKTFLVICAPIAGKDYVNIYGVDITERKRAEEALRESESRFRTLFETMAEGFAIDEIICDEAGNPRDLRYLEVNPAFERHTGLKAADILGRTTLELFPDAEPMWFERYGKVALTGEPAHFQAEFGPLGRWFEVIAYQTEPGRFATVFFDITERKQAEEALRQHREDLDRAQEVGQVGSWRLDVGRNVLTWSDENHRIFGVPKGTPQTYETFLEIVHPDDRQYVDIQWKAGLRGEPYDIEHRIVADGRVKWVREKAYLEFDDAGELLGGFGITQDITERKLAEEALERLRTEFMGMVTHELKTPLTAIKGSAATALGSQRPLDGGESRELFEIIDEQADRLRELMDNLLDATRIEAGTLSVRLEPTDLREVIEDARATFARGGGLHQIRLEVPADMPHVQADRRRLFQVLMNLLNNAGMFSSPTEPITIAAEHDSLQVTVHVRDRGRGIPKEKLPLLFKKFSRLHDDSGQRLEGTGLGLAICKGIVEAHGGRIWADSAGECEGSTFSFTLPAATEVSVKALSDEARRAVHLGRVRRATEKTRVLAVDDEPQILRFLRRSLNEAGYQPIVTADPCEVAKLVELEEPDLVLLDLMLPGTTGFELLQRIREFSGVPVIFLTASDREEDAVRALKEGADDYITKPFSPSELLARIGAALRRRVLPDVMEARPAFALEDLTIDFAERRVTVAGREVSLSATEYKILHQLATHAGRPLSYEHLLRQVWGPEYSAETELVRSFIRNLRRRLGDDAQNPRFIFTERQVGYRMPKP